MISNFPDPYPYELTYSIVARYDSRKAYKLAMAAATELFGIEMPRAIIDFPKNLQYLEDNLPPGSQYTADYIIDKHTLFPYHAPFIDTKRRQELRDGMKHGSKKSIHTFAAKTSKKGAGLICLRYCPNCAKRHREVYGETYWNSLHQIPEVKICPECKLWLQDSSVSQNLIDDRRFIPAEDVIPFDEIPLEVDLGSADNQIYLFIAQAAKWLFEHPNIETDAGILRQRYGILALNNGFASYSGRIYSSEILNEFHKVIPEHILSDLGCELTGGVNSNWLTGLLLRDERHNYPPIRHLLFAYVMGVSMQELLLDSLERLPFGKAAFPCLNLICENHLKPVITSWELVGEHWGRVEGRFHCQACGFVYHRHGPDFQPELWKAATKIIAYGHLFEAQLRDLLQIEDISINKMAKLLRCSKDTIKMELNRLGLPLPKNSQAKPRYRKTRNSYQVDFARLAECKAVWLDKREQYPDADREALKKLCQHEHYYIKAYDPAWLEENSPEMQRRGFFAQNWSAIDDELLSKIDAAYEVLLASEKPIWINSAELSREMGLRSNYLSRHRENLPKTHKRLGEIEETVEDWAIRRLWWAGKYFIKINTVPTAYKLFRFAGVSKTRKDKRVAQEAEKVLVYIYEKLRQDLA